MSNHRERLDSNQHVAEDRDPHQERGRKMKRAFGFLFLGIALLSVTSARAEKTVLAGGCFWCMESDFEKLEGVTDVISGFTGGVVENPTYNGNHRGHYEAVEITYDPDIVSYRALLDYYWVNIDPFDADGQFCDKGFSYLSAIFVSNEAEQKIAEETKKNVQRRFPDNHVVTPILSASTFYPIKGDESYHQDFYKKSPVRYRVYRWNCGRDRRLKEIWGEEATH